MIWRTIAWRAALGNLTSFGLHFHHSELGGWIIAWNPDHKLLPAAQSYFWNHLRNVTHLSFSAAPNVCLGADFTYSAHIPFSFGVGNTLKLKTLELDGITMGSAVVNMMIEHAATLREVKMQHVFAVRSNDDDWLEGHNGPQVTWQ